MTPLNAQDAAWLAELHQAAFTKGWDAKQFSELLASDAMGWRLDDKAFILLRCAADEAEIITLATAAYARRQGHASTLLEHSIVSLAGNGITQLFLEVKDDNEAAFALYRKYGFKQTATRPAYYTLPDGSRKDARVMLRKLDKASQIT